MKLSRVISFSSFGITSTSSMCPRASMTTEAVESVTVSTYGRHFFLGSLLCFEIQGADRYLQQKREVSVVSGTGEFRYARGYAVLETVELDAPNAVIKFNLTIRYPVADS
ncbi:hypothetical protein EJ110_NYTH18025 [Nymphaea thermarum]|nr:hypothetical protein EJ110_NYTH18025 [Nymphaea thermarum]